MNPEDNPFAPSQVKSDGLKGEPMVPGQGWSALLQLSIGASCLGYLSVFVLFLGFVAGPVLVLICVLGFVGIVTGLLDAVLRRSWMGIVGAMMAFPLASAGVLMFFVP